MKLGETLFGVTVWAVLPDRTVGQRGELEHLTWKGPGYAVRLHSHGVADGNMEYYGPATGTVSGPCHTEAEAQQAADAYLAGLTAETAAGHARGPAAGGSPDWPQPWPGAEMTGATGVPAAQPADETAWVLAEFGTPEKRLQYALWEAARRRRDAYAAAGRQLDADGDTATARQRHDVAYEAAHGRWAAETATAAACYAREIGASRPASRGPGDVTLPYTHGGNRGTRMLEADITHRPAGYDDIQWLEYVAGYADGARFHAQATVLYAEAVREQAQRIDTDAALRATAAVEQAQQIRHLDPLSQEYARDYNNGWRASERYLLSDSYQVLTPLERADQRNVPNAWYDGYHDHAADRPKWTYQQARLAGFDSAEDYLIGRPAEAPDWRADLLGGPPIDVPDHVVVGAHSARPAAARQREVAPRPADFPASVQPAAPLSASTGRRAAATRTASPAAHSRPRGPR